MEELVPLVLELMLMRGQSVADAVPGLDRRLGVFRVHGSQIGLNAHCFDLFSRCVPVFALPIAATGEVEYLAASAEFDPVDEGAHPPPYAVRFSGGRARFERL